MKKIIVAILMVLGLGFWAMEPAMAADQQGDKGVETTILKGCGEKAEGENGEGIKCVLSLVIDIMAVGVGVLGILGIVISGIQYITAGGNEQQTVKAKRRIFEVVIGLVVFALMWAVLRWLLPSFGN